MDGVYTRMATWWRHHVGTVNGVVVSRRPFQGPTTTLRLLVDNNPGPNSTFYAGDGDLNAFCVFPDWCISSPSLHPCKISSENGSPLLWTGLPRSRVSSSRLSISMSSVSTEQLISGKITGGNTLGPLYL